ncbi:MAG TPA: tetratricopeptide repeat protein, partial [Candidatus Eremiobacteraeota bacterium]|nr:tetratricopeptide repeat protein [Candidatus Eremiobacteraeota bacterium]
MSEGRLFSFPRPPEIFVGREKELNRLKEGFKSQNFIIIDGIAGIGKTSLALTLAGIINEDPLYSLFHNNVFWIECKEGWQIDNLLYEINRSLKYKGENSFDKSLEDERMVIKDKIHYLLTLLNKNYYVIFIDDYHKLSGSESVFFLEKLKQYLKKSKVVTISREKPKVSPVIWLETFEQRLKGLAYNDINILIKELLELHDYSYILDKKILNDLTRTTKGHPLLIKTLLCILISGGHTIVDLLEDAPSFKEATDDYLISQIISNLKEDERELLFSASLFRLPVKKEAFHYVYPVEKLDRLINSLQGKFLLNLYCANTYLIHDLIRDFCYASLLPDKKKELHRRCALYYEYIETIEDKRLPLSKEAFYHYIESGKTDRASEILENIMNEMVRYLQLKELEQYIDKIPLKNRNYRINLMKAELFFIKGDYKSTMNLLEDISDTEFTKTELINLKAKCNLRLGKYEKAMEYVDRNLKICQDVKTLLCLIKALEIKGIINFELRNYEEALTCFRKAIDVNDKEMKSSEFEISLSLFMGMTLERMGKTGEALEIHLNCLNLAEKTHNLREIPGLKINIGWDYYQMGEMEKAYEYLEQGLEIAHTDRLRVYSLYFMGLLFEEKNEEESAFSNFLKALKIAEELGDIDKQTVIKIMIVRL